MSTKKEFVDKHPYLPFTVPVPRYTCPKHGRIWESAVRREDGFVRCRMCNTVLLTYPTIFKPTKPKPRIREIKIQPVTVENVFKPYDVSEAMKGIEFIDLTPKKDSVLFDLIELIIYLILNFFLLAILWKLLTGGS